ncbi:MAG: sulfite exporter TauE/SafE family protein, partial [Rikenellaceae bacterium]|nr:sulfite exporter TauE/SafE family protein [Rikenellaceae bacterium]
VVVICLGVFCASFMDAIGGGGGIISVPCYLLAGIPVHYTLGTNKLSACIGTVASTIRYVKNGCVDWLLAAPSIVLAMMGAHLGTRLQLSVDERYLKLLLLVVLPVIAVVLLKKKDLPETTITTIEMITITKSNNRPANERRDDRRSESLGDA